MMNAAPAGPSVLMIDVRRLSGEPALEAIEHRRRLNPGGLVAGRRGRDRVAEDFDAVVPICGIDVAVARRGNATSRPAAARPRDRPETYTSVPPDDSGKYHPSAWTIFIVRRHLGTSSRLPAVALLVGIDGLSDPSSSLLAADRPIALLHVPIPQRHRFGLLVSDQPRQEAEDRRPGWARSRGQRLEARHHASKHRPIVDVVEASQKLEIIQQRLAPRGVRPPATIAMRVSRAPRCEGSPRGTPPDCSRRVTRPSGACGARRSRLARRRAGTERRRARAASID